MSKKRNKFSILVIFIAFGKGIKIYRILTLAIGFLLFNETRAQFLSPTVLTAAGNSGTSANCIMDWTLGEIAIETLSQTSSILTQGFHQNLIGFPSAVDKIEDSKFSFYPNPARDFLYLSYKQTLKKRFRLELFNTKGIKIWNTTLEPSNQIEKIDLNDLPGGIYLIKVSTVSGEILMTHKFVKL